MGSKKYNLYDERKAKAVFPSYLKDLLQRNGLDKEKEEIDALAEYLGCTSVAITQFRDGKSTPQPRNLVKIAQYYNVSLDTLFGLSNPETPEITVQAICEYTGLSRSAVLALHQMSAAETKEEKRPLSFINRSLENKSSILSLLDQYITSSLVRRRLEDEFRPTEGTTIEEYKAALAREDFQSKIVTLISSDDMVEGMSVGKLYREAKMTQIRSSLDGLRKEYDDDSKNT